MPFIFDWHGMAWHGMAWHGMFWVDGGGGVHGMLAWFGLVGGGCGGGGRGEVRGGRWRGNGLVMWAGDGGEGANGGGERGAVWGRARLGDVRVSRCRGHNSVICA